MHTANLKSYLNALPENLMGLRANFDRYSSSEGDAFLHFTDVRDAEGKLIKKSFIVSATQAMNLVGNLLPGQEVEFSAEVVIREGAYANDEANESEDKFDFTNVCFITPERKE